MSHDFGKNRPALQARPAGAALPVDHSAAGAKAVLTLAGKADDRSVAVLIAHAIAGHHAGLPDTRSADDSSIDARIEGFDDASLDERSCACLPHSLSALLASFFRDRTSQSALGRQSAMLGRMRFSCLVDAGAWTERIEGNHFAPDGASAPARPRPGAWIEAYGKAVRPETATIE